jgi:hypothetical protein
MHMRNWLLFPLLAIGLLICGCKKGSSASQPYDIQGVKVDLPKLREAFVGASPEMQTSINQISEAIRYGMYPKALPELAKLAASPSLTAPQKKVVEEVTAQINQLAGGTPAPPAK